MKAVTTDLIVLGGGLAGLMAASEAQRRGRDAILIDVGLPSSGGALGGFAPFSGAKFSLYPAGTGLAPLVGGTDDLIHRYLLLCRFFASLGMAEFDVSEREVAGAEQQVEPALAFRQYHSVLLTPDRMRTLLDFLENTLTRVPVLRIPARMLRVLEDGRFAVELADGVTAIGHQLIAAAGRLGAHLLHGAGVPETRGKGIDVGVRLAFASRAPVAGLRELGPDSKFMSDGVRTFCLNSPGRIYHYPGEGFSLPGGIVADADWHESNVGILCRLSDRVAELARLRSFRDRNESSAPLQQSGRGSDLGWTSKSWDLVGENVANRIDQFVARLAASGLVELPTSYEVHYPLLDWHWPVFSTPERMGTAIQGLLAAGDLSGHARGLMQAALMGVLAVEECST